MNKYTVESTALHEAGHAIVAAHYGYWITSIEVTGPGLGMTYFFESLEPYEAIRVAMAGDFAADGMPADFAYNKEWRSFDFGPSSDVGLIVKSVKKLARGAKKQDALLPPAVEDIRKILTENEVALKKLAGILTEKRTFVPPVQREHLLRYLSQ